MNLRIKPRPDHVTAGVRQLGVEVNAENITEEGFDVVFRTWADTHAARARVRWMAIGEVYHADDWELY